MTKRRLRVAIIVNSLYVGGSEKMVAQLTNALDNEELEILLIVNRENSEGENEKIVEKSIAEIIYTGKGDGFSLKSYLRIWTILDRFSPEIIHTHLSTWIYSLLWAFVHRVKIIHTIHFSPKSENDSLMRRVISLSYKRNIIVPVAISYSIRNEFMEIYNISENMVEVIFNPVDTVLFRPSTKVNHTKICFISVGRLVDVKNIPLLLEAFSIVNKKIMKVELKIVGDGMLYEYLNEKVDSLNLRDFVKFIGNSNNVSNELQNADIFISASKSEGLPLSILEAMATGLPIVATKVGGVPDIVTDNGILVESENVNELAAAMYCLAIDDSLRSSMGSKSRKNVLEFDISNIAKQYKNVYFKYSKYEKTVST